MLSRGKVTPATVSYYSDEVARGLEDYYAGRGEGWRPRCGVNRDGRRFLIRDSTRRL